ncbi:MAG: outer membrane lipoprotein-sorting protein [Planctomycetota bacterium]|nr:outer membrane lipoprotein-sorting protein [Planctomycetota bacterium]
MKPRPLARLAPAALVALAAATAWAQQDLTAEQIVRRADRDHRSRDERGVVEMVLISEADDQRQLRSMEILGKTGEGDDDLNLVRFLAPPTVRGTAVLTVEATGRADDQWLYLPALKKTKRIASTQRTQRFAGTDFTYEDLRTENFAAWTYRKLDDARVADVDCFVVEATPRDAEETGYSKRVISVEKARFLIHKVEFFDKQGRHHKTLVNRDWEQVQGLWRSRQAMMEDHQRRTKTIWRFTERAINPGLPDGTFTEANLERGL